MTYDVADAPPHDELPSWKAGGVEGGEGPSGGAGGSARSARLCDGGRGGLTAVVVDDALAGSFSSTSPIEKVTGS